MGKSRRVFVQVLVRGAEDFSHVEFVLDEAFSERLRQLRTLVPPLTGLSRNRDLVIDKVRVRLPSAIWRCSSPGEAATPVDGSSLIIGVDGIFNCSGRVSESRERIGTYNYPVQRLSELHAERADGEPFFLHNGMFTNDEPVQSASRRWAAALQAHEHASLSEGVTDFDTLPGEEAPLSMRMMAWAGFQDKKV